MVRWQNFAETDPELAAVGRERLTIGMAYLATLRLDGAPRLHPITPVLSEGDLFLFFDPVSPIGHDLRRDPRYALHSLVTSLQSGESEFWVTGIAELIEDNPLVRVMAMAAASQPIPDNCDLFRCTVESAASTVYAEGQPLLRLWNAPHFEE